MEPEYADIIENNAIKSSIGPMDVKDCITALLRLIEFMLGNCLIVKIIIYGC